MERINVRVEPHLKRQLEAEAREKGVRAADIVREALEAHVKQRTPRLNCRELAEQLGILGCAEGLPTDLSSNPKHMEGFGLD